MPVTINGTTGISNDGGYTGDGVVFADATPANTLVTTTGGNVGIGTSSPAYPLDIVGAQIRQSSSSALGTRMTFVSTSTNGRSYQIGSNFSVGAGEFAVYDETAGAGRFVINSAGIVTTPFQPAFYADAYPYSAAQTRTSGVVFNSSTTANFSTVTNNGSHFNTSTGRFTAPVAGRYFFVGQYSRSGGNATTGIRVNGGTTYSQNLSYGTDWQTGSSSAVFSLNANDYVEFMYGATNSTTTSSYTVNFGGYLIG